MLQFFHQEKNPWELRMDEIYKKGANEEISKTASEEKKRKI